MQPHNSEDRNGPNGEVRSDFAVRPEDVVARRRGEVLLKHTILKSDHFPGECPACYSPGAAYSAAGQLHPADPFWLERSSRTETILARRMSEQGAVQSAAGRAKLPPGARSLCSNIVWTPILRSSAACRLNMSTELASGNDFCVPLQVPELPVYGCAIPTVSGLRHVLHALGASNGE